MVPAPNEESTVSATPSSARVLAASVTRLCRSPCQSQASTAAAKGAAAKITVTAATDVRVSALMKQTVAMAEQAATIMPSTPEARITATMVPRWRQRM